MRVRSSKFILREAVGDKGGIYWDTRSFNKVSYFSFVFPFQHKIIHLSPSSQYITKNRHVGGWSFPERSSRISKEGSQPEVFLRRVPQIFGQVCCFMGPIKLMFYCIFKEEFSAVSMNTTGRTPPPPPKSSHLKTSSEGVAAFVKGHNPSLYNTT